MKRAVGALLLVCAATAAALGIIHRVLFTPKGGDPDNHLLHQLADDPIFRGQPPGVQSSRLVLHPTTYESPGFGQPGGWQAPYVTLTFESSATKQSIYRHYAEQASAHGWRPANEAPQPYAWEKPYPGGVSASLTLLRLGPTNPPPGPLTYQLAASAALPAS